MPETDNPEERWQDRKIYNRNIIQTYIDGLSYLKNFIPIPFKLDRDSMTRIEMVPAYITVREALANLLMHRDYFDTGIAAIRIFPNRIVFRNPGASLLSLEEMLAEAETAPRNPIIARVFRLIGWAETAGSGMYKMQTNWKKAGFPPLAIRNNYPRGWFTLELSKVKMQSEGTKKGSPSRQYQSTVPVGSTSQQYQSDEKTLRDRVFKVLKKQELSIREISKNLGQARTSGHLKIILQQLRAEGKIEYTLPEKPQSRLQKYRLVK
jgi:predicted HTH transcriptional regulator